MARCAGTWPSCATAGRTAPPNDLTGHCERSEAISFGRNHSRHPDGRVVRGRTLHNHWVSQDVPAQIGMHTGGLRGVARRRRVTAQNDDVLYDTAPEGGGGVKPRVERSGTLGTTPAHPTKPLEGVAEALSSGNSPRSGRRRKVKPRVERSGTLGNRPPRTIARRRRAADLRVPFPAGRSLAGVWRQLLSVACPAIAKQ